MLVTGVTVHLVDAGVDTGPILAQESVAVLDEDDWVSRVAHPDADPLVTRIFSLIQPIIIRAARGLGEVNSSIDIRNRFRLDKKTGRATDPESRQRG